MSLNASSSGKPRSLVQCFDDGKFSDDLFMEYSSSQSALRLHKLLRRALVRRYSPRRPLTTTASTPESELLKTTVKKSRAPRCVWGRLDEDGNKCPIPPEKSCWFTMYVDNELLITDKKMKEKFRRRFRLPYVSFLDLVEQCKSHEMFHRWCGKNNNNKRSSPIELLLLGSLRYLGRGWTFDDIEEATAISRYVHVAFFKIFICFGSTVLFPTHVRHPRTARESETHINEFAMAGLPGCIGSSDCTHIVVKRCQFGLRNQHLGAKSSCTTRTFNLTVNHRRQILHTSRGGPGGWNDQTMVRRDNFINGLHQGDHLDDVQFYLEERDDSTGEIKHVKYRGAYVIVDNGYLRWSVTVPPFKVTNITTDIRWSKWIESMRKDVECTFGILKGRWRILKAGIGLDGVSIADDIWMTCCALHNMLLDIDGLSGEWKDGIPLSDWLGELGEHDDNFALDDSAVPNAIKRLSANLNYRMYDTSGMGVGDDELEETLNNVDNECSDIDEDSTCEVNAAGERTVRLLSLNYFRKKLVEHFDILMSGNRVQWPARH